jgi:hypothetical protein
MNSKTGFIYNKNIFTTQQKINNNFCLTSLFSILFNNRMNRKQLVFKIL